MPSNQDLKLEQSTESVDRGIPLSPELFPFVKSSCKRGESALVLLLPLLVGKPRPKEVLLYFLEDL